MIRPFGLRDAWTVKELQPYGVALDLERQIVSSSWPWLEALSGYITRTRLGSRTFVYDTKEGAPSNAFAQIRMADRRGTWDLSYLAPKPSPGRDNEALWVDFFRQLLRAAAQAHISRVRARIPKDRHLERLLQLAGFVVASRERVMVCSEPANLTSEAPAGLYKVQREDAWRLRQLHRQVVPPILSQIEGPRAGHVVSLCSTFPNLSWQQEYVWKENGAALVHFMLSKGLGGSWINIVAMPVCRDRIEPYLRYVLSQAAQRPNRAACVPVPDYAADLARPLGALGFEPLTCQTTMIANIAKRVRVADEVFVRGLQPQADI